MLSIRPSYRFNHFTGFCVVVNGEPVGKAMRYVLAALLLEQLRGEI